MKKGIFRKMVAVAMTVVMLCSAAGCGKKENENPKEMVYAEEEFEIEGMENIEGKMDSYVVKDKKIYFTTGEWVENGGSEFEHGTDGRNVVRLYSVNLNGKNLEEIPFPELQLNEDIKYLNVNDKKEIVFLKTYIDGDKEEYTLCRMNTKGEILLEQIITKDILQGNPDVMVLNMLTDKKGQMTVVTEDALFAFDKNGALKQNTDVDFTISGAALTKDGNIVCGVNEENKAFAFIYDIEKGKWSKQMELPAASVYGDTLINGVEDDFYTVTSDGIYGYSIKNKKFIKRMDYAASCITAGEIVYPAGKDKFLAETEDANGRHFLFYKKTDAAKVKDKKVIVYGTTFADDAVKQAINVFNRKNTEYKIEIRDYSEEEEPEIKMATDIIAGKAPDIIDLSYLPIEQYAAKGMLLDLTSYFDKDEEIKKEDILPSVLEAMQTDGKLYYVAPRFHVSALTGKTEDVDGRTGWTFEELKELLKKKGKGVQFTKATDKRDILFSFAETFSDYVDFGSGECYFDSQNFKNLLELSNQGKNNDGSYTGDEPGEHVLKKTGKVLFQTGFVTTESMQVEKALFESDIAFIGLPNKEKDGTYFSFSTRLAIYAESEVKDEAWEFISTLMTKENQAEGDCFYDYPTRMDAFEMAMQTKTATESYTDELGRKVSPIERMMNVDDMEIKCKPLSKEEENAFRELINRTTRVSGYNEQITNIIMEEAEPYFLGEKSLEDTTQIIQKRIQTYVNEGL